jgi:hypothetical protein
MLQKLNYFPDLTVRELIILTKAVGTMVIRYVFVLATLKK